MKGLLLVNVAVGGDYVYKSKNWSDEAFVQQAVSTLLDGIKSVQGIFKEKPASQLTE